jgi:hypothetical protein
MSAINFPNNPALNEEFTQGEKVYRWNGFRWRAIPASLITIKGQIATQVTGPASAVANQVATFDGTTGKLIKDSGFTIETSVPSGAVFTDTGDVNIIEEVLAEGTPLEVLNPPITLNVTNVGSGAYEINSEENPQIVVVRGETYTFNINAVGHPFNIQSTSGVGGTLYNDGVTNNGTDDGVITWVVQSTAPNQLFYACGFHSSMQGTILVVNPKSVNVTRSSLGAGTGDADVFFFTTTIAAADTWTTETGYFTLTKTVTDILVTDEPIVDIDLSNADLEDIDGIQAAWSTIYFIETKNNEVVFYSLEDPDFTANTVVKFKVVR